MIGKVSKGRGFGGTCRYLLCPTKGAKILGTNIYSAHRSPTSIAMEFRTWAEVRPSVQRPVVHFPIAFAPADGKLDESVKTMIAMEFLESMGYGNCQYLIVEHSRNDPDHPKDHDHDHIHLLTTAVDFEGGRVSDSFDQYKLQAVMRRLEADYGLQPMQCSWEKNTLIESPEVKAKIMGTLWDKPTVGQWVNRLEQQGVRIRFNLSKTERVQGIAYVVGDRSYEGRSIGLNWPQVKKQLVLSMADLNVMKVANQNVQQARVAMSQAEYQQFRTAQSFAISLLAGKPKLDNSRLLITNDQDGLKVIRKRPHKLMFAALEGVAVGFPNINPKDIALLTAVAKRLEIELENDEIYIQPMLQQEEAIDDWEINL